MHSQMDSSEAASSYQHADSHCARCSAGHLCRHMSTETCCRYPAGPAISCTTFPAAQRICTVRCPSTVSTPPSGKFAPSHDPLHFLSFDPSCAEILIILLHVSQLSNTSSSSASCAHCNLLSLPSSTESFIHNGGQYVPLSGLTFASPCVY
jgi:hypothetical protein